MGNSADSGTAANTSEEIMNVGEVRIAEDSDFALLKVLLTRGDGWTQEYSSGSTQVSTRPAENSHFRMIRLKTMFTDVSGDTLYDVLHDPVYRKTWDKHMLSSSELGVLNPNNDLSYYALHCPPPLKNRDFVLQRSWLKTPQEYYIINHSVFHKDFPTKKGFVRGLSYLTGFLVTPLPKGCINYNSWKNLHNPTQKPWLYPDQISNKRIQISDCVNPACGESTPEEDESSLSETDLKNQLDMLI